MSHYGFTVTTKMTDAALLRACLHLREARWHLQAERNAAGLAALYDSVLFGMHYYITNHRSCTSIIENLDLWDASGLFHGLARAGVFDDPLAFNRFSLLVERALWQGFLSFDRDSTLVEVERMLTKLGVLPFCESALPRETPAAMSDQRKQNIVYWGKSGKLNTN